MTRETITLNQEEQRRVMVLTAIREGRVRARQAAQLLGVSLRHCRRLLAAYRRAGPAALAHGNRGRPPHNRLPEPLRRRVVRLARTTYIGFNHQHVTEVLAEEHGLVLSRRTVRRLLLAAGLPSPHPRRPRRHRRRRERMPQAGLLVQVDASHHSWLEGRGPTLALHGVIDDATNRVPAAVFRDAEDAHGYFLVLRDLVRAQGRPVALYGDRHGIFHKTPHATPTIEQQLRGLQQLPTQFGRALRELGIRWIPATSPQAKGRIERLWGTFQDRLVSELRRAHARTRAEANAVLAAFLPRYNARFAHAPADPHSAYRSVPPGVALDDICCFKYERSVANDNTVRLQEHLIQLLPGPQRRSYAKARVMVHEHLDGALSVVYQGTRLAMHLLTPPPPPGTPVVLRARGHRSPTTPPPAQPSPSTRPHTFVVSPRKTTRADHPWNRYAREAMRRKQLREAGVTFSRFT